MKIRIPTMPLILIMLATPATWCQDQAGKAALQQRVAELKQSVAANQAKLRKYQWLQTTQVNIKGEQKKQELAQCRYGPDGKVQKTPVGDSSPQPKAPPRGLRGKVVQKKVEEMQDYMERLKSLISHYAPPDPQMIQTAMQAEKASLNISAGAAALTLSDYYKPGDKVTFTFDTAAKKLQTYNVDTYLDDPQKDVVTMTNQFAALPDGTNYLQKTVLNAQAKQIQITTTNSGHSLVSE